MPEEHVSSDTELLDEIAAQQESVDAYLDGAKPRFSRLTLVSILGSAVAAALTAGPAMGGTTFTEGVQGILALSEQSTVWRLLCLAAALVWVAAGVGGDRGQAAALGAPGCAPEVE